MIVGNVTINLVLLFHESFANTNLLSCDDEAFVEQLVLNEEKLLDVFVGPEPVTGQASHLQKCVDVLEKNQFNEL